MGYLNTHERYAIAFDTSLMLIAVGTLNFANPRKENGVNCPVTEVRSEDEVKRSPLEDSHVV
jgi:hypothetical protein